MGNNDIVSVGTITSSENIITTSTEVSSSTSSGALRVYGGAGLGSLYVEGLSTLNSATILNGSLTMGTNDIVSVGTITSSENIKTTSVETASSTTTGALQVSGGAGIGSLFVEGTTTLNSATILNGNLTMGINDIISIGDITSTGVISTTTTIKTTDPTLSSSTATGALQVTGGAGIGSVYVHDYVKINGTTESLTTTNGTLIIAGGVGIAKNVNIGGSLNVSGDISSGYSSVSSSFTGPCTLTATLTCYKIGHLTLIHFPETTDTVTTSTYFTGSGIIPSDFRPSNNVRKMIFVKNNNVEIIGSCSITTDGNMNIYTGSSGNFTLSGIAGFSLDLEYIN
jgi:hypothetical protein